MANDLCNVTEGVAMSVIIDAVDFKSDDCTNLERALPGLHGLRSEAFATPARAAFYVNGCMDAQTHIGGPKFSIVL